jgi:hypothetical protein
MNIDDRIREEFERRDADLGDLALEERSLFGALYRVFTGGWRRWAAYGMFLTLTLTAVTFWTGYHFFVADSVDDRLFWGLITVVTLNGVGMLKMWFFLEMNLERDRAWTARELKRLEIALVDRRGSSS